MHLQEPTPLLSASLHPIPQQGFVRRMLSSSHLAINIDRWTPCKSLFLYVKWLNLARIFQGKLFNGKILSAPSYFLKENLHFKRAVRKCSLNKVGEERRKKNYFLFTSSPQYFLYLLKITSDLQAKLGHVEVHAENGTYTPSHPHSRCCLFYD